LKGANELAGRGFVWRVCMKRKGKPRKKKTEREATAGWVRKSDKNESSVDRRSRVEKTGKQLGEATSMIAMV